MSPLTAARGKTLRVFTPVGDDQHDQIGVVVVVFRQTKLKIRLLAGGSNAVDHLIQRSDELQWRYGVWSGF